MSWFSSAIKGIGHAAGKVLSNPIVQTASAFIPGVGPLITAGEGALGGLLKPGGNLGLAARGGLQGAASGLAGGGIRKLGAGILHNGLGSTVRGIAGGTLGGMVERGGITGNGRSGSLYDQIIDYDAGGNPIFQGEGGGNSWGDIAKQAIGGAVRKIGGGTSGHGVGLGDLAVGGLAGWQAINAANASKRAGQLSDKALGIADSRWADAAPLRAAAQSRLLTAPTTDIYTNTSNPFAVRPIRRSL